MDNNKNIKILVCYHKKNKLYKNDVLVPIHCGRSIARQKSKDGIISEEEYNWLLNNTIGDDTGENISDLNRDVNEMTALYWAWKNYKELGNPDYIGLMHYRRLFNFSKLLHKKNFSFNILNRLGCNQKTLNRILENYSFISRKDKDFLPKYTDYKFEFYQNFINLSENYHSILYKQYLKFLETKEFYCTNMFVMKREDFFNMCEEIFPVMFDILGKDRKEISRIFLENIKKFRTEKEYKKALEIYKANDYEFPRLQGYSMERIVSLYFMYLHEKYSGLTEKCDIKFMRKLTFKILLKKIFSIKNKDDKNKTLTIIGIKINYKRKKRKELIYK